MGILDFATRLAVAFLLGALIGVERQWRQRSAGLRTNTLVSLGAASFLLLAAEIAGDATGRVASYIVSGIGFLGAGVIMKDGGAVQGLNTAATIWCSAAVGALCGVGLYPQATLVALAIILTHVLLRPLGLLLGRMSFSKSEHEQLDYMIKLKCSTDVENAVRISLMQMLGNEDRVLLKSLSSDDTDDKSHVIITAIIRAVTPQDSLIEQVASRLTIQEKVVKVRWEIIGAESEL
ncbi:MgtC/SapB family protein [Sphingobacterium yanglingense]|uniref:Protein MgtC n=1 Tax=Sphingobacterium yanglingense TaxID=1437280 RepID=A0A4R6WGJ1_9SPHI|nr:MgtC/SapB family protein [Sphingobacterium yanglingense]TDQ77333.1 putative Mg2+ transporter-C (MgtC) family protein [Sphingobacterium yanglingense]